MAKPSPRPRILTIVRERHDAERMLTRLIVSAVLFSSLFVAYTGLSMTFV